MPRNLESNKPGSRLSTLAVFVFVSLISFAPAARAADLCSQPSYNVAPSVPTTRLPVFVLASDFNGDGKSDLAMTASGDGRISVLPGTGNGTFGAPIKTTSSITGPFAVGDLNGDGKSDLVSTANGFVAALLGNGNGTFTVLPNFKPGNSDVSAVAIGDFNADGKPDLSVSNTNSSLVHIVLGNGDGTFGAPNTITFNINVASSPGPMVIADFNGDGKNDLAVACAPGLALLLGNGNGTFSGPTTFTSAGFPLSIAAGDFNSDGKRDIVLGHFMLDKVSVLIGNGAGGFAAHADFTTGPDVRGIVVADFNDDSKQDVATVNRDADTVSFLPGDGAGSFGVASNFLAGATPVSLTTADFNTDGKPDLAAANIFSDDISILLGLGGGNFAASHVIGSSEGGSIVSADFNGDGKQDIAQTIFRTQSFGVMLGTGNGEFAPRTDFAIAGTPNGLSVGDFNRDGKIDLAVVSDSPDGVFILLGTGNGSFNPAPSFFNAGTDPRMVAVGDLNGDGKLDLVLPNQNSTNVSVFIGDGGGGFNGPTNIGAGNGPSFVVIEDFDGDTRTDLAVTNVFSNNVSILKGDGNGNFSAPVNFQVGEQPINMIAEDLNGDGRKDLAIVNGFSDSLSILFNSGGGSFAAQRRIQLALSPAALAADDFNGDGVKDLAVTINRDDTVAIFIGDGAGSFNGPYRFHAGFGPGNFALTDFNGDGRKDFAVAAGATLGLLLDTRGAPSTTAPTVRFCAPGYNVQEGDKGLQITVTREGDTSSAASVFYSTSNLTASDRSDYTAALGTLRFAAGEVTKTIPVFITDDAFSESSESFILTLSAPTGATLGSQPSAAVNIFDNDVVPGPNPVSPDSFDAQFFVRQHYLDFLNREPDAAGLQFWTNEITSCGTNTQCQEVKRVNVSAAFFLSIEFQETGYLGYRLHQTAFGTGEHLPLRVFLPDSQEIGRGIIVGVGNWEQQLEANKQAFIESFVARQEFTSLYPQSMSSVQFVNALNANTADPQNPSSGGVLSQAECDQLADELNSGLKTRAQVLREIAENAEFRRRQSSKAFVLMQYFGYLRRNPNASPDSDFSGYNFWLSKLNQFNGNFVQAEMVKAFITSIEYRKRFGQ
jgi:hypothetical protein